MNSSFTALQEDVHGFTHHIAEGVTREDALAQCLAQITHIKITVIETKDNEEIRSLVEVPVTFG